MGIYDPYDEGKEEDGTYTKIHHIFRITRFYGVIDLIISTLVIVQTSHLVVVLGFEHLFRKDRGLAPLYFLSEAFQIRP